MFIQVCDDIVTSRTMLTLFTSEMDDQTSSTTAHDGADRIPEYRDWWWFRKL